MYNIYLINKGHGVKFGEISEYKKYILCITDGTTSVWQHALTDEDKKIMIYTFPSRGKTGEFPPRNLPPPSGYVAPSGHVASDDAPQQRSSNFTSVIAAAMASVA